MIRNFARAVESQTRSTLYEANASLSYFRMIVNSYHLERVSISA